MVGTVDLIYDAEASQWAERGADVVWTTVDYICDPCEGGSACPGDECEGPHADACVVCQDLILGHHMVCLDDGDSAHPDCVTWWPDQVTTDRVLGLLREWRQLRGWGELETAERRWLVAEDTLVDATRRSQEQVRALMRRMISHEL